MGKAEVHYQKTVGGGGASGCKKQHLALQVQRALLNFNSNAHGMNPLSRFLLEVRRGGFVCHDR